MSVKIVSKHNISLPLYRARNTHIIVLTKVDSLRLNVDVNLLFCSQSFDACVLGNFSECTEPNEDKFGFGYFHVIPFFCGQAAFCRFVAALMVIEIQRILCLHLSNDTSFFFNLIHFMFVEGFPVFALRGIMLYSNCLHFRARFPEAVQA